MQSYPSAWWMSSMTPMRSHNIQTKPQIFGVKGTLHAFLKGRKGNLGNCWQPQRTIKSWNRSSWKIFQTYGGQGGDYRKPKWPHHYQMTTDCTLNGLTASVDNERESIIYPDFWKASDMVPHNFLAAILESYGFDGWIIRCIKELVEWPHPTSCCKWFNVQMETGNEYSSRDCTDTSAF